MRRETACRGRAVEAFARVGPGRDGEQRPLHGRCSEPRNRGLARGGAVLLATPVILAAGALKLPSLAGPAGAHIHGQVLVGSLVAGSAAYASVRFLVGYVQTRTLTPFALYSLLAGVACGLRFSLQ